MSLKKEKTIDTALIKKMLDEKKGKMKLFLSVCVACGICADSCFLYVTNNKDPRYMPSYKVINSLGILYKKKGKVDRSILEKIMDLIWKKCVLCSRCYCPIGINIPSMIAFARNICRSQGIYRRYDVEVEKSSRQATSYQLMSM